MLTITIANLKRIEEILGEGWEAGVQPILDAPGIVLVARLPSEKLRVHKCYSNEDLSRIEIGRAGRAANVCEQFALGIIEARSELF